MSKGKLRKALSVHRMRNSLILSGNENAWNMISQQKAEISSLKKQVEALTKERDRYMSDGMQQQCRYIDCDAP